VKYKEIFKSWKVEDMERKKIEMKYGMKLKIWKIELKNRTEK
jgi:hypothetical protein